MRIAFTVDAADPEAAVGAPFGRCKAFIVADTRTGELQIVPNPAADRRTDAGVSTAGFIIAQKIDAVVSGSFGLNTSRMLAAAGIATYCLTAGSVCDFIDHLRNTPVT